jgi:hypothetical protein
VELKSNIADEFCRVIYESPTLNRCGQRSIIQMRR